MVIRLCFDDFSYETIYLHIHTIDNDFSIEDVLLFIDISLVIMLDSCIGIEWHGSISHGYTNCVVCRWLDFSHVHPLWGLDIYP